MFVDFDFAAVYKASGIKTRLSYIPTVMCMLPRNETNTFACKPQDIPDTVMS